MPDRVGRDVTAACRHGPPSYLCRFVKCPTPTQDIDQRFAAPVDKAELRAPDRDEGPTCGIRYVFFEPDSNACNLTKRWIVFEEREHQIPGAVAKGGHEPNPQSR